MVTTGPEGFRRLSLDDITAILGEPDHGAVLKVRTSLDLTARRFIAHSPFLCMATSDGRDGADCSPRGDEPGFVRVLSPQRLAIPDRTGNNLAQSFRNLWKNDAIGLLFLVPGMRESLRVNGTGYITDDEGVRRRLSGEGRPPRLAVIVDVHEVYFHCGKAIVRSRLWDPEANALADGVGTRPSVFSMQKVDLGDETASSELSQELEGSYVTDL